MSDAQVRKADWVVTKLDPTGPHGFVTRMAKDGSWVDVRWSVGGHTWTKRMRLDELDVKHTIRLADGGWVTDETRKRELEDKG